MATPQLNVNPIHTTTATEPRQSNLVIGQTATQIKSAAIADQRQMIATILLAFSGDPTARWLYSKPADYLTYFQRLVQTMAGKPLAQGTAYCMNDYSGAALWFSPGVEPDINPVIQLFQESLSELDQADALAVFEQTGYYHPQSPHWYLAILGVEPTQQGKGFGSALIKHVLKQCDRDRIPAYLEASKPANIAFYQRHGFEVFGEIQVGASPSIFPMIRYPNKQQHSPH